MKPPFKFSWEEVTPGKAAEWLEKNAKNRNLRQPTVEGFASDMARGAWSPSHQGIAFAADGRLLDGQHRLAAIVLSGATVAFLICRDVPESIEGVKATVADAIDRGNPRSVADVLKLSHGYTTNSQIVTAACWNIAAVSVRNPLTRVKKLSVSTAISIAQRYRAGLGFVSENRPATVGLRAAPICGAIAFAYAAAPRKTEEFYKQFSTGVGLKHESPTLVLRNAVLNDSIKSWFGKRGRIDLCELTLHALWCVINRKEMSRIPKAGCRPGADWFRQQQAENVRFVETLFPTFEQTEKIVSVKNFRLTPAARELLSQRAI